MPGFAFGGDNGDMRRCIRVEIRSLAVSDEEVVGVCVDRKHFCRESWRHIDCFRRGAVTLHAEVSL